MLCLKAEIRINFDNLYKMMARHEEFRWMMLRIRRMADTWIEAIKSLAEKQNLEKRKRKKVSENIFIRVTCCSTGSVKLLVPGVASGWKEKI